MGRMWDVIVVGAGPAGCIAARELARRGHYVLLLDKAKFPRPKVCGCCVNGAGQRALERIGLSHVLPRLNAACARRVVLCSGGRMAELPLRAMAVSRAAFDAALVDEAVRAGVQFQDRSSAVLGKVTDDCRTIRLRGEQVTARLIVAADGLAGTLLRDEPALSPQVAAHSRMGAGLIIERRPRWYRPGAIVMACGSYGYVGTVQLEDGRINLAAALHPHFVQERGGPGPAAQCILTEAGLDADETISRGPWRGTPLLTRRRIVARHRLLMVGDAAGYLEPFTGEGMAWAIASAAELAPIASHAIERWSDDCMARWTRRHRQLTGQRTICRAASALLRRPRLTAWAVALLAQMPWLAAPVLQSINLRTPEGRLV